MDTLVSKFLDYTNEKMRNIHLNQILMYINSQENTSIPYTMSAKGILIYPQTREELNYTGIYEDTNHHFHFCSVDLNKEWWKIDHRLKRDYKVLNVDL